MCHNVVRLVQEMSLLEPTITCVILDYLTMRITINYFCFRICWQYNASLELGRRGFVTVPSYLVQVLPRLSWICHNENMYHLYLPCMGRLEWGRVVVALPLPN